MEEGPGFSKFLWDFVDGRPKVNQFKTTASVPASTPVSIKISKELRRARLQIRRPDHRLRLHAGDRHGQRPSRHLLLPWKLRRETAIAAPQSQMTAAKRAAADTRVWQRMLSGRRLDLLDPSPLDIEIDDIAHGLARVARWNGQTSGAHIFSVAQHTLLVEAVMRARDAAASTRRAAGGPAARCAGICHRRHDLAVQGGDRRRLQGGRDSGCSPRSTSASDCRRCCAPNITAQIKDADRGAAYLEATRLAGFARSRGAGASSAAIPACPTAMCDDYLTPWSAAKAEKRFLARFNALRA